MYEEEHVVSIAIKRWRTFCSVKVILSAAPRATGLIPKAPRKPQQLASPKKPPEPNPSLQRTLLKLRSLEKQKHQLSRRGQRSRGGSL
jgi:hypothetical protein